MDTPTRHLHARSAKDKLEASGHEDSDIALNIVTASQEHAFMRLHLPIGTTESPYRQPYRALKQNDTAELTERTTEAYRSKKLSHPFLPS